SSSAKVCSATLTALPPGVLMTRTPRRVASSRSILSTPTPARPTTRRRGAFSSSSGVTLVALRTISASALAISALRVSFVVRTMFQPAVRRSSTPRSLILSATMTFIGPRRVMCLQVLRWQCAEAAASKRITVATSSRGVKWCASVRCLVSDVLLGGLRDGLGPVREVIQGLGVGGVEMEWSDGDGARKNRGIIGVRRDVFVDALLEKPVIGAAAGIFSFAQLIAGDFFRLAREFYSAGPRLGHVYVEQDLVRQSFLQN